MAHAWERCILVAVAILLTLSTSSISQEQPSGASQKKPVGVRVLKQDGDVPRFKAWLDEDVVWIITEEERAAYKLLKNDEERDQFVEAFWARRNPTPDTFENEYKVEHYHRIADANDHFNTRIPGWKTDRGRIYIVYGPPDKIESYPSGRTKDETPKGEEPSLDPEEVWHYRYLEGVGMDVVINFIDACGCDEYQMKMPPEMKDAILSPPTGLIDERPDRRKTGDPHLFLQPGNTPSIRFRDLEALLNTQPPPKAIPFEVRIDFEKVTSITFLVPVTIAVRNRDFTFVEESGVRRGRLKVFGRFTTLTGHVADVFEDSIEVTVPKSAASETDDITFCKKTFALNSGYYGLAIVVKDANAERAGTWVRRVVVARP
jgi:GWxTD domain-containing protein